MAKQVTALEANAVRRMRATAKLAVDTSRRSGSDGVVIATAATQMQATVLDIRSRTRLVAAAQFADATGLEVTPSGTVDAFEAARAATSYAMALSAQRAKPSAYAGGSGTTVGGGSTSSWDEARIATHSKIDRIAAWEVMHAWNDEHRRNADALPQFKFVERWCAILDIYLCPRCRKMNGKRADVATGGFAEGWPPLHPDCRCFITTTIDTGAP